MIAPLIQCVGAKFPVQIDGLGIIMHQRNKTLVVCQFHSPKCQVMLGFHKNITFIMKLCKTFFLRYVDVGF